MSVFLLLEVFVLTTSVQTTHCFCCCCIVVCFCFLLSLLLLFVCLLYCLLIFQKGGKHKRCVFCFCFSAAFPYAVIPSLGCTDVEDGTTLTYALTQSPGSLFSIASGGIQLDSNYFITVIFTIVV